MNKNAYTAIAAGMLFPLHELFKGHSTVAVRKAMEASQWWSGDRLNDYQVLRIRRLLERAEQEVPYYRNLFAACGFSASQFRALEDLQALPFLTKELIRTNSDDLRSAQAGELSRFNTSGSSGEPLVFYTGKERVSHDVAAKWRATRWWNVDIGDPEIVVWGSPIETGAQDWLRSLRDRLLRTELLPAFDMSKTNLDRFLLRIRKRRPKMLFGYPSALSHIAGYARENDIRMDNTGIRVAFVTSERLYDDQRNMISDVFGCRVANGYGGRDAGFIAHECPEGGMHITAEDICVEVVDAGGHAQPRGIPGEIVVTHAATGDFPFIRYRTGDVGILDDSSCPCGRGLPLLREIQGRTSDFIVARDGTVMHGLALMYVVRDIPGIEAFKIIQESRDLTRILLCRSYSYKQDAERVIREGFASRLGEGVAVQIEYVDDIPAEASGKHRYIVSHAS